MQKNAKKICTYQKKVVPLHRQMKKTRSRAWGKDLKTTQLAEKCRAAANIELADGGKTRPP